MKTKLHFTLIILVSLALPILGFSQAPTLGTAADFALFSSNGAVSSTGFSHITGHVGTANGSSTNFGNVDGVMHDADGTAMAAKANLLITYNQLNAAIPTQFHAAILGNGETLTPGVYAIDESASINGTLTLNGNGNENSVFIFKIDGAFSSSALSQVILTNSAKACNVFWKTEGLADLATGTIMKGTIVADQSAIILNTGVMLEGRALSTTGAVTVHGATIRTPLGCGSPTLTGPAAPPLASAACYTIFSASGAVSNTGISFVTGDVGTNVGLTTGFNEDNVTGTIHSEPDTSTAQAAIDLNTARSYISVLNHDIELLYPAQFGNDLVLTPHTYLLNAATVLTNKLTLNAQGNPDAVFVIKIVGALSTSTFAEVILSNEAQQKNVFWLVNGAVEISNSSKIKGTIICHNAAMNIMAGNVLAGRAFATTGAIMTNTIDATMPAGCIPLAVDNFTAPAVTIYPNPFTDYINISLNDFQGTAQLEIYNSLGQEVIRTVLTSATTRVDTNFTAGIYYYKLTTAGKIKSGKILSAK
ncbi:MAG: ice-binding family protein [Flavobacterium sp.]